MPKPEPGNAAALDPVISTYTRARAIKDGILVDVSDTAREAGFTIPVAVTRTVWDRLVAPSPRATAVSRMSAGASGTSSGWRATTRFAPRTATA